MSYVLKFGDFLGITFGEVNGGLRTFRRGTLQTEYNYYGPTRTDRSYVVTKHAKKRMATRCLRADAVGAALNYGRVVHARGAVTYAIGRKEIARYAVDGINLSDYDGVQVVVTSDGTILTVYRNRCFKRLRDFNSHRSRLFLREQQIGAEMAEYQW
ncbi:MAG: DUF4258 domain-containing protein [Polyangiaceae bacterium]|nr:DUF4258 domain-containing protein [Polyangiaceae bacterium]